MIIPVRCFTCNNVIASKYKKYIEMKKALPKSDNILSGEDISVDLTSKTRAIKDAHGQIFKELGVSRYCCKRCLISHIDLIDKI